MEEELEEDFLIALMEPTPPTGFYFSRTEMFPADVPMTSNFQLLTAVRKIEWQGVAGRLNQELSHIFHNLYASIMFKLSGLTPCVVSAMNLDLQLQKDNVIQIVLLAQVCLLPTPAQQRESFDKEQLQFELDHYHITPSLSPITASPNMVARKRSEELNSNTPFDVCELTPMTFIPGAQLIRYVGRVNLHFVKESFAVAAQGGVGGFQHKFINEVGF